MAQARCQSRHPARVTFLSYHSPNVRDAQVKAVTTPAAFGLLSIAHTLHVLRRRQLWDPGHMDAVTGALLGRAVHGEMSLEELSIGAGVMQRCGRREDMRALQAHFVRAVQDRQQLHGVAGVGNAKRARRSGGGAGGSSSGGIAGPSGGGGGGSSRKEEQRGEVQ
ncbi:hypothetical protein FOA52_012477 [Chlamydomonas sp. UWO 241]|nr:hypothetical protein FOA52_012477 [Chlamydomonas sp. UWO 241]